MDARGRNSFKKTTWVDRNQLSGRGLGVPRDAWAFTCGVLGMLYAQVGDHS